MIFEVFYEDGPLGRTAETVNVDWQAANRVMDYIRSLASAYSGLYSATHTSTHPVGSETAFRQVNLIDVPEGRRALVYAMIDEELAHQEEDQQDG